MASAKGSPIKRPTTLRHLGLATLPRLVALPLLPDESAITAPCPTGPQMSVAFDNARSTDVLEARVALLKHA